jgi:hypothetical protein
MTDRVGETLVAGNFERFEVMFWMSGKAFVSGGKSQGWHVVVRMMMTRN